MSEEAELVAIIGECKDTIESCLITIRSIAAIRRDLIRQLRTEVGSASKVAELLGITRQAVYDHLRNTSEPPGEPWVLS